MHQQTGPSSDEPLFIDRPLLLAKPSRSRSARAGPSNLASRKTSPRARVSKSGTNLDVRVRRRSKYNAVGADDDEPIFVGSTDATRLAEKFGYRSKLVSSSPTILRPAKLPSLPPLQLVPPPIQPNEPIPVPSWLGKTAVLLQLLRCVVCRKSWKKSESGAARWVGHYAL